MLMLVKKRLIDVPEKLRAILKTDLPHLEDLSYVHFEEEVDVLDWDGEHFYGCAALVSNELGCGVSRDRLQEILTPCAHWQREDRKHEKVNVL